jgi:hypothetical protein
MDVFASGGGLDMPYGLVFGPDAYLYVASLNTNSILRYDGQSGAFIGVFASGGGMNQPCHILFTPEPATLSLLALGGLALIRRGRK